MTIVGQCDALHAAMMTAIICHHSATIRSDHERFAPAPAASAAFTAAMGAVDLAGDSGLAGSSKGISWSGFPKANDLSEDIINVENEDDVLLYLVLVRILRLADQRSQEHEALL